MADSDHLVGALVFTVSITAYAETARPLRALNMVFGAWLIVLAIPRGPIVRSYAGWDRYLVW